MYATETKVPVAKTQGQIRTLILKSGGTHFGIMEEPAQALIVFILAERKMRFSLPLLPAKPGENAASAATREKVMRSRWRALLLVIKAKIESVESKIETFEEAFLAQVIMPGGETVYEQLKEPLAIRYRDGSNIPLLAGPK